LEKKGTGGGNSVKPRESLRTNTETSKWVVISTGVSDFERRGKSGVQNVILGLPRGGKKKGQVKGRLALREKRAGGVKMSAKTDTGNSFGNLEMGWNNHF